MAGELKSPDQGYRKLTRRQALRAAGVAILGAGAAACGLLPKPDPTTAVSPTISPATGSNGKDTGKTQPTPKPEVTKVLKETDTFKTFPHDDMFLDVNSDMIPLRLRLSDGRVIDFDLNALKEARNRAKELKESQIATMVSTKTVRNSNYVEPFEPTPLKPRTLELPKDVVSERDLLNTYRVTVIQGDTKIFFRESAFLSGGIFEKFAKSGKSLTVVMVNGPYVLQDYLKDPKYDRVRPLVEAKPFIAQVEIDNYRAKIVATERASMAEVKQTLVQQTLKDPRNPKIFDIEQKLEDIRENIYFYGSKALYPDELIEVECFSELTTTPTGKCISTSDASWVFIASKDENIMHDLYVLQCQADGTFEGYTMGNVIFTLGTSTQANQTMPQSKEFETNPTYDPRTVMGQYKVRNSTPGLRARHEFRHVEEHVSGLDYTEYAIDEQTLDAIDAAYLRAKETQGKGLPLDTSGYQILMSLSGQPGYIYTKNNEGEKKGERLVIGNGAAVVT